MSYKNMLKQNEQPQKQLQKHIHYSIKVDRKYTLGDCV